MENAKLSHAQQAKVCDPEGCGLPKEKAAIYWGRANFVGLDGEVIRPVHVHSGRGGQLSVEFPDGSILSSPRWQM
jgi:hypothetical protein